MLARARESRPSVLEEMRSFDRLAEMLQMPSAERLGILNLSADDYAQWQAEQPPSASAELRRRLDYALFLMRRAVANAGVIHISPPGYDQPPPSSGPGATILPLASPARHGAGVPAGFGGAAGQD